jgi:DNA-binding NarL/FixJ family response regulator
MTEKPKKQIKILIVDKFSLYRKGLSMAFAAKEDIAIIREGYKMTKQKKR